MIIDNCYVVMPENAEEVKLANEVILKLREDKLRAEHRQKCKMIISSAISDVISQIGLAETKNIVRELNRELREMKNQTENV